MLENVSLFEGAVWYLVFLFSTTLHEASHAWAALKLGDDTAHRGGQVTLDPTPHIRREPFGMVLVPILSYALGGWMIGWASAPYDPYWASRYPRRAGAMSLAGPASNLLLVVFSALFIRLGMLAGFFHPPELLKFPQVVSAVGSGFPEMFAFVLSVTFSLNLLLFLFNLLPFPPLDGSAIPVFFLSDAKAVQYSEALRNPAFTMIGLIVAWKLFPFVFRPVHLAAVNILYPELSYR